MPSAAAWIGHCAEPSESIDEGSISPSCTIISYWLLTHEAAQRLLDTFLYHL